MPAPRTLFWRPTAQQAARSPDALFRLYINERYNLDLKDYFELHAFSINNLDDFWSAVYDYCGVIGERTDPNCLFDGSKPMADYNPQLIRAKMNYAENMLLSHEYRRSDHRALVSLIEPTGTSPAELDAAVMRSLSFEELYVEVKKVAHTLRSFGIKPGDRVATYSPSNAEAVILCLGTLAVGAVWSSCPAEFGVKSTLERLEQIEPKVLLTADFYKYNGKKLSVFPNLLEILAKLPTVQHVIVVGQLEKSREPSVAFPKDKLGRNWWTWNQIVEKGKGAPKEIAFHRGSAMDPVWVLYSSGTTGKPKAIVHSVGGMVLGQQMLQALHNGTGPGDSQLTFTTLGWMMHNHMLSALGVGCAVIAYDGSPFAPSESTLWALASRLKITILGLSPRYISTLEGRNYLPNKHFDLKHVTQIQTAGSPLEGRLYDWMRENVGQDAWINNGTGGTDICGLFVGAAKSLPIYHGELTTIGLGMALEAWDDDGNPHLDKQGEMVITKPFPNMPIYFWPGGEDGSKRYKAAYYEAYPGKHAWCHGDFIEVHSQTGGIMVYGRSDGVLNPGGVRFGSSEIYSVVEKVEGVEDCLAVGQKLPDGDERFVLFIKPKVSPLSAAVKDDIKSSIRANLSTRHVPGLIVEVPKIPLTGNGKRLEVPVKKLINGVKYESLNLASAEDPELLRLFVNHPELALTVKSKL